MSAIPATCSKLWTPSRVLLGNFLPLSLGILLAQLADTLAATAPNPPRPCHSKLIAEMPDR